MRAPERGQGGGGRSGRAEVLYETPSRQRRGRPRGDRRPWYRRGAVMVVGVLAVVSIVGGALLGRAERNRQEGQATAAPRGERAGTGRLRLDDRVWVGYPRTPQGALAAATNYLVALGSEAVFDAASRRAMIATLAHPSVEADMQRAQDEAMAFAAQTDPATVVARVVPVTASVVGYREGEEAEVSVWSTSLVGLTTPEAVVPVTETWAPTWSPCAGLTGTGNGSTAATSSARCQ